MTPSSLFVKAPRYLSALLASCVWLIVAVPRLHAQLTWVGTTTDASNVTNYSGSLAVYDVTFGQATNTTGLSGSLVELHNLYFTDAARPTYSFDTATLNLDGNITVDGSSSGITFGSGYAITLTTNSSHSIDVGSADVEILGVIAESGVTASISKSGSGSLTLAGINTFCGGVTVNSGTLLVGNNSAVGTGTLKLYDGTTLGITGVSCVALSNAIALDCNNSTTVTIDLGGSDSLKLTGSITGAAELKQTGGTLTLSGSNDFSGGVSVNAGTLLVGSNSAVGTGTLKLYDGTTLGIAGVSCVALSNAIALDCNNSTTVTIDLGCSDSLKLTGDISGAAGLTQTGGTLTLSGDNDFSGGVTVLSGATLLLGSDSAVGSGDLKLYDDATLGITAGSCITLSNAITLDCNGGWVTVDLGCNDTLKLTGNISGSAGLVQTGGTLTLSGCNNSYSGGTTINGGTLIAASDYALGSGNVNVNGGTLTLKNSQQDALVCVNSGGTLNGNGRIEQARINVGGTLSPGTANCLIGELDFGDLTLAGMSTMVIGVKSDGEGGLENSEIVVQNTTTLDVSGVDAAHPLTLKLISEGTLTGLVAGQTYHLPFLYYQNANGTLSLTNVSLNTDGFYTDIGITNLSLTTDGSVYTLSFTPVPEPSTYALMGLGLCLSGMAAWRKRRNA